MREEDQLRMIDIIHYGSPVVKRQNKITFILFRIKIYIKAIYHCMTSKTSYFNLVRALPQATVLQSVWTDLARVKQWLLLGYACDMDVRCTLTTTLNGTDIGALCGLGLW